MRAKATVAVPVPAAFPTAKRPAPQSDITQCTGITSILVAPDF